MKINKLYESFLFWLCILPTISTNMLLGTIDVTFQPNIKEDVALEDAMNLLSNVSTPEKRLIVVFDEFQEVVQIQKVDPNGSTFVFGTKTFQ